MNKQDFSKMTGPQLVAAYNAMASAAGLDPVKRFSNTAVGLRRCLDLAGKSSTMTKTVKPTAGTKNDPRSKIAQEFDARNNTVREKLLNALATSKGKQISIPVLLKACYGSQNIENKGALVMSIKGAMATIKSKRLAYQIKKEKNAEKEISFGLYPKN